MGPDASPAGTDVAASASSGCSRHGAKSRSASSSFACTTPGSAISGLGSVSLPCCDGPPDQLLQAASHPPDDRLTQQRRHQQVTVTFKRSPLLGSKLLGPVPQGQSSSPRAAHAASPLPLASDRAICVPRTARQRGHSQSKPSCPDLDTGGPGPRAPTTLQA